MEYKVSCIRKKEKEYSSGFEGEVLQMFGISPTDYPTKMIYCNVAFLVESIKNGDKFFVELDGKKTYVRINTSQNGLEYVETIANNTKLDNLLLLPPCTVDFRILNAEKTPISKPERSFWDELKAKPLWALLPFLLGLLLLILYCLFFGCCGNATKPKCDTVFVEKIVEVPKHCPTCDVVVEKAVVHFKFDKTEFDNLKTEDYNATLEKCLTFLKSDSSNFYVELAAYADYKGGSNYNEELAAQRELVVANYFLKNGVKQHQITIQEENGNYRARKTKDANIQAQDRKVEIRIYGIQKK